MKKTIFTLLAIFGFSMTSYPCGPDFSYQSNHYSFYSTLMLEDPSLQRFAKRQQSYYNVEEYTFAEDGNIEAWKIYLNDSSIVVDDIRQVVYKSDKEELLLLLNLPTSNPVLPQNTLIEKWAKDTDRTAIEYLIYAKECEPYATNYSYYWEEKPQNNTTDMRFLLEKGQLLYANINNPTIKMRYAYQMVRLAHYMEDYPLVLELFEQFVEPMEQKDYMYYRALEHKAGALATIGNPEAYRFFAQVFNALPDRRNSCAISLQMIRTEAMWEESLALCQTREERTTLHAMRAYLGTSSNVGEMENILDVYQSSPYLELLAAREIKKLEQKIFPIWSTGSVYPNYLSDYGHLQHFYELCKESAQYAPKERADFWLITLRYIELAGLYRESTIPLTDQIAPSSAYYEEAVRLDFVDELLNLDQLTKDTETRIGKAFTSSPILQKDAIIRDFMMSIFYKHYYYQRQYDKAFMCFYNKKYLAGHLNYEILKGAIGLVEKKNKNDFEHLLVENLGISSVEELYYLLGYYHLNRNQLEDAAFAFEKAPKVILQQTDKDNIPTDFAYSNNENGTLDDSLQIDRTLRIIQKYPFMARAGLHPLEEVKALQELEKRALQKDINAAEYNFILGCYWSNQQHVSFNNFFIKRSITENELPQHRIDLRWEEYFDYAYQSYYYNPDIAIRYLDKAIQLSSDRELQAKACFMAAAAERYRNYGRDNFVYFGKLLEEYSDTEYYQEAIRECHDFKVYCARD